MLGLTGERSLVVAAFTFRFLLVPGASLTVIDWNSLLRSAGSGILNCPFDGMESGAGIPLLKTLCFQ